ncbi:ectonucleotide pyrophosphatase/phosphodiesterase [Thalassotalea sp. SU-HH00458]|uniref:alkaline phosphatase family protein n=1 Tax=Thalassotalea sp. SU-HH00458 TaxID=3127657 RepID=UPI003109EB1E
MTRIILISVLALISFNSFAKNPVILLSVDGFSQRYLKEYQPKNILALSRNGVIAQGLIPTFPSKTFPNHLSIVTGMYPANHGIIHNNFYNRSLQLYYTKGAAANNPAWLFAKPIWTIAEQQGIKSAIYFWPESEAKIDGVLPSYYFKYKHNESNLNRINQIVDWLKLPENQRPELIIGYFSTIDDAGHHYGPNSTELAQAVKDFDQLLGQLLDKINQETELTPNFVLVSDHGMMTVDKQKNLLWKTLFENFTSLNIVNGQTQLFIYEKNQNILNDVRSHLSSLPVKSYFQVFDKSDYPEHWHFNNHNAAVPDMVINALPPTIFIDEHSDNNPGVHGYDPYGQDELTGIFITQGPDVKTGIQIDAFENIHVFSLLEKLLEISPSDQVDSQISILSNVINTTKANKLITKSN